MLLVDRSSLVLGATATLVLLSAIADGGRQLVRAATADVPTAEAEIREAAGSVLGELAQESGALGYYWDATVAQYKVVVPANGASTFKLSDTSGLGVRVGIESRDVTEASLAEAQADLESLAPSLGGLAYGFYFDAESGTVILQSEAPIGSFESVIRKFPNLIEFHSGKFNLTSWNNPTEPFLGGAYVNSTTNICTSGFTAKTAAGTRRMVTAGHCFANGTATTMGTASRTGVWPNYDVEVIVGRTYAAGIYDSPSTSRAVSSASNPSIGSNYCTTGRTTGFVCTWIVRSLNVTICYPSDYPGCAHGLAGFLPPTDQGTQYLLVGDSGGPLWYKHSNGGAGIRGVNSGVFFDIATARVYSYATMYQTIASQLGVSAVTTPVP